MGIKYRKRKEKRKHKSINVASQQVKVKVKKRKKTPFSINTAGKNKAKRKSKSKTEPFKRGEERKKKKRKCQASRTSLNGTSSIYRVDAKPGMLTPFSELKRRKRRKMLQTWYHTQCCTNPDPILSLVLLLSVCRSDRIQSFASKTVSSLSPAVIPHAGL